MMTVAGLALAVAGWWLGGIALYRAGTRRTDETTGGIASDCGTGESLGTGLLWGIVASTWLSFVWSLAGGSLSRPFSLGLASVGIGLGLVSLRGNRKLRTSSAVTIGHCDGSNYRELSRLCAIVVGGLFLNLLVQSLLTPQSQWDERAIYAIKGKVLFEDRTVSSPALLNPDFVQYHPRYPLLLPLAEAHLHQCIGHYDDRWGKVLPPLLYLGVVLSFAGVTGRRFGRGAGWVAGLLLATIPGLATWNLGFLSAQADAPLAALHGASVLYLWDALQDVHAGLRWPWRSLLLAGLFAGGALFTKDEGLAYALLDGGLLVCCGVWVSLRRGGPVPRMIGSLAPSAVALAISAPWFWHRRQLPDTTEMTYFSRLSLEAVQAGWPTLAWSVPHVLREMFLHARLWGLQWWGLASSAILCPVRAVSLPQLFLLLDVAGALAALLLAGMLSPTPVEEHIGGSAHRYLLQISPVAVLFLVGQWGRAAESDSTATS